ncbi:DUF397 domain-containing protein [Streptomyces sp. NBC_01485]|uniref:DUF397 domain-containing protein n=1 Tax=Streptomyces sp. NBC_01485 TaxID=2903884 RepID=UPI002E358448|nr:DUF397 domain-containing protein [Streptomyces sp. NBC_01485]
MPVFHYRKSTYSDDKEECVEVATNIPTTISIRDSKHPTGPNLRVTPRGWLAFQAALVGDDPRPRLTG